MARVVHVEATSMPEHPLSMACDRLQRHACRIQVRPLRTLPKRPADTSQPGVNPSDHREAQTVELGWSSVELTLETEPDKVSTLSSEQR